MGINALVIHTHSHTYTHMHTYTLTHNFIMCYAALVVTVVTGAALIIKNNECKCTVPRLFKGKPVPCTKGTGQS